MRIILSVPNHFYSDKKIHNKEKLSQRKQEACKKPEPEPFKLIVSNIAGKSSNLFYLTFRQDPGGDQVYIMMKNVFGDNLYKVVRVSGWYYEIQLLQQIPWEDIKNKSRNMLREFSRGK